MQIKNCCTIPAKNIYPEWFLQLIYISCDVLANSRCLAGFLQIGDVLQGCCKKKSPCKFFAKKNEILQDSCKTKKCCIILAN